MGYEEQRRYPRRAFNAAFGLMNAGEYTVFQAFEIGEKGAGLHTDFELKMNDQIVACFFINNGNFIVSRAIVRFCRPEKLKFRIGIEFTTIKFEDRRIIRDYIADRATEVTNFTKNL